MHDKQKSSLVKNTVIYAIGSFGSKVLSFLLVPLYSFYLNKEEFGYFDLVITAINLIVPFVTLQISDSIFRWLLTSKGDEVVVKKAITNGLFLITINIFIIAFISTFWYFIHPLKGHLVITLICINAMLYPFVQQVARGFGNNKLFAFNGLLYTIIYLTANIIFLMLFKLSIEALFYSTLLAYFICSLFLLFQLKIVKYLNFKYLSLRYLKDLLLYSVPLIPNTISWWLISSVNKYLILFFLGISANGLFAMSNRFPVILVMVNQVFTLAWQEAAILKANDDDKNDYYTDIMDKLIRIQFSLVVILSLLSQFIAERLISSEFYGSWVYMPVLYLSVSFLSFSGFYGALYLGVKKTKEIFLTTIFGGLVNIIAGYILIHYFGLMGVAIATCFGYGALFIIRIFSTKRIIDFHFPIKTFTRYTLFIIVSFVIAFMADTMISLVALFIFLLILLLDNREFIISVSSKFLLKKKY